MDPGHPSNIRLRAATNADRDRVVDLVQGCLDEYGLPFDETTHDHDLVDIEASYTALGGVLLVAETDDGHILGSVGLVPEGDHGMFLRKMYVERDRRSQGIGRLMMEAAMAEARRQGARSVTLQTMSFMTAARRLYEGFGFREVETVTDSPRVQHVYRLEL